jgi:hypothetical protein
LVEQACSEVNMYTDEHMLGEFDRFFQEQPSICDFVTELTSESDTRIQELSLFLAYMVFKTVKLGHANLLAPVTPDNIEEAYRDSESWIDRINEGNPPEDLPEDTEPYLIQYVISELNQPLEDGTLLGDEEKGEVFFVLKTVISSFTRSPLGKETQQ